MPQTNPARPIDPDLLRVRALFSRPDRIAASDFLRREISKRMAERLDLLKFAPARVLDAGCGTGEDLLMLQQRYPGSQVIGLDAASEMLTQTDKPVAKPFLERIAGRMFSASQTAEERLCGDFAAMPLISQSFDMLWSNLALHWHAQPEAVFAEWRRVLRRDGLLMFSCFGPDTFKELGAAFAAVDAYPHALVFADMHDLGDRMLAAGFTTPVVDMEMITLTYDTPEKLLQDVRAFGGNPLADRRRGLFGRQAWSRVLQELELQRLPDGRIPLTIEVIYGHAFKPAERERETGESVVNFMPRKP